MGKSRNEGWSRGGDKEKKFGSVLELFRGHIRSSILTALAEEAGQGAVDPALAFLASYIRPVHPVGGRPLVRPDPSLALRRVVFLASCPACGAFPWGVVASWGTQALEASQAYPWASYLVRREVASWADRAQEAGAPCRDEPEVALQLLVESLRVD